EMSNGPKTKPQGKILRQSEVHEEQLLKTMTKVEREPPNDQDAKSRKQYRRKALHGKSLLFHSSNISYQANIHTVETIPVSGKRVWRSKVITKKRCWNKCPIIQCKPRGGCRIPTSICIVWLCIRVYMMKACCHNVLPRGPVEKITHPRKGNVRKTQGKL